MLRMAELFSTTIDFFQLDEVVTATPEFPSRDISISGGGSGVFALPESSWSMPNSPKGQPGSTEISLDYLPNPMEAIEELNKIKVRFTFDDELPPQARKRRATIARSRDSAAGSDMLFNNQQQSSFQHQPHANQDFPHFYQAAAPRLATIPNERLMIQSELLDRLEQLSGMQVFSTSSSSLYNPVAAEPRLGIYNQEERIERINAYREKRKQRVFKKVRYVLRKRASEGRSRVKGRFAKEDTSAASTPIATTSSSSVTNATAMYEDKNGMKDSVTWLEKMTIGARSLTKSMSRKRSSLPSRPAATVSKDIKEGATSAAGAPDEEGQRNSWSSWLMSNRRKSSTSTSSSNRKAGSSGSSLPPAGSTPPLPLQPLPSSTQLAVAAAPMSFEDFETDNFIIEHMVEPDRKRLTSGSSALFSIVDALADENILLGDDESDV